MIWLGNEVSGSRRDDRIGMLRRVVSELHCCEPHHLGTVHVVESDMGRTYWEGDVEVFATSDQCSKRCYAWVKRIGRRKRIRFFAVLGNAVIKSALDAVKFAHVASNEPLVDQFSRG